MTRTLVSRAIVGGDEAEACLPPLPIAKDPNATAATTISITAAAAIRRKGFTMCRGIPWANAGACLTLGTTMPVLSVITSDGLGDSATADSSTASRSASASAPADW